MYNLPRWWNWYTHTLEGRGVSAREGSSPSRGTCLSLNVKSKMLKQ
jgi:hypothetical protein